MVELICELQYYILYNSCLYSSRTLLYLFEMYEVELSVTRSVRVGGNRFK